MVKTEKQRKKEITDRYLRTPDRVQVYNECDSRFNVKYRIFKAENGDFLLFSRIYDMEDLSEHPFTGFDYYIDKKKYTMPKDGNVVYTSKNDEITLALPRSKISIKISELPLYEEGTAFTISEPSDCDK